MSLTKQEALDKIKELEEFVKDIDKPKMVRIYIKEKPPKYHVWNSYGEMDYLKGTIQEVDVGKFIEGNSVSVDSWAIPSTDYIALEEV